MTLQEREHWDHESGCASEVQNCLTEAQHAATHEAYTQGAKIQAHLDAGLFVVVDRQPHYCRATDALAGSVEYLRGSFPTRAEAEASANVIAEQEAAYGDGVIFVLPALPVVAPVVSSAPVLDDVPF